MTKLMKSIVEFSKGNTALYEMFVDYWNHYRSNSGVKGLEYQSVTADGKQITFSQKEEKLNAALKREILRVAGMENITDFPVETFANHPVLNWATFAVVNQLVDAILPDSIIDSIGMYTDVRVVGYGDSLSVDLSPRDLFVISKSGRAMRQGEIHKNFKGQVTLIPEEHALTVGVSLYRVLAGKESLADLVARVARSFEADVAKSAYTSFATAMAALDNAGDDALRFSGYTQETLVALGQKVSAWNGGNKAIVCGTQLALQNILPTDANYRYSLDDEYAKLGYVRNIFGLDIMMFPQFADWQTPFKVLLDDTKLWLVSPSAQKLVKLALEGSTRSYTDQPYDNANLTQQTTLYKSYVAGIATNAVAGIIELS